jgi:hypothetical protein
MTDLTGLQEAWGTYRDSRLYLLDTMGIPRSCRDPLSEFAELLVARLVGGTLADNRVQKDWDVASPMGRVQVKYLANPPTGGWVNWHTIEPNDGMDWYALVIYLDLSPVAVYMFPSGDLTAICQALGKRDDDQATMLQFTKTNHRDISADPEKFEALGMRVFLLE